MDQKNAFLGTEPIGRLLFRLAIPTVIAQLVNMLYNIVDRIYIGHMPQVGSLALTGLGVCTPIILIVSAFAALVASGGAPRASISMGKGDLQTAEKMLGGCFSLQLGISAVLTESRVTSAASAAAASASSGSDAVLTVPALLPQEEDGKLPDATAPDAVNVRVCFDDNNATGFAYDPDSGLYRMLHADGTP